MSEGSFGVDGCSSVALIQVTCCSDLASTPWNINMEHNDGCLEDEFPLQMGAF